MFGVRIVVVLLLVSASGRRKFARKFIGHIIGVDDILWDAPTGMEALRLTFHAGCTNIVKLCFSFVSWATTHVYLGRLGAGGLVVYLTTPSCEYQHSKNMTTSYIYIILKYQIIVKSHKFLT